MIIQYDKTIQHYYNIFYMILCVFLSLMVKPNKINKKYYYYIDAG